MKVTTKTRYGLRAMVDLAKHYKGKPVLVREIAKRQKISNNYLEQIMLSLKKAGLVESISGARGGYILIKRPAEIKIFNIVKVLEGSISPVPCIDHREICKQEDDCSARSLWLKVKKSIKDVLTSITLKDLTEEKRRKSSDVVK
jgi:Rrf2 family transcriptional regulator, cysteine metabolism repressor